jgi:hypothetical protein
MLACQPPGTSKRLFCRLAGGQVICLRLTHPAPFAPRPPLPSHSSAKSCSSCTHQRPDWPSCGRNLSPAPFPPEPIGTVPFIKEIKTGRFPRHTNKTKTTHWITLSKHKGFWTFLKKKTENKE